MKALVSSEGSEEVGEERTIRGSGHDENEVEEVGKVVAVSQLEGGDCLRLVCSSCLMRGLRKPM